MKLNNIFKRKEVNQLKADSDKEKDTLFLKDALQYGEKEEFQDQLISLMVPIIIWKEFPYLRRSELATSIVKGQYIIGKLKLKYSSLDENYINDILGICFKQAKYLVRAEIGAIKNEKVDKLTYKDIFEYDYSLSIMHPSYLQEAVFGKNLTLFVSSVALLFTFSIALFNIDFIPWNKHLAVLFFEISTTLMLAVNVAMAISAPTFRGIYTITSLLIFSFVIAVGIYTPRMPTTPIGPQSSTPAKPSPSPKTVFVAPSQNLQSIHQKGNK